MPPCLLCTPKSGSAVNLLNLNSNNAIPACPTWCLLVFSGHLSVLNLVSIEPACWKGPGGPTWREEEAPPWQQPPCHWGQDIEVPGGRSEAPGQVGWQGGGGVDVASRLCWRSYISRVPQAAWLVGVGWPDLVSLNKVIKSVRLSLHHKGLGLAGGRVYQACFH